MSVALKRNDLAGRNGSRIFGLLETDSAHAARFEAYPKRQKSPATATVPRSKRILDLGFIFLTSPVWLPVLLLLIFWLKVTSRGPALFRQQRIGFGGAEFFIFKLRTMKVNAETQVHESYFEQLLRANCPMTKLDAEGDPRFILGGALLRAAGLDELPQIFNVLRGEMSLVGPRPCTPHEFDRYTDGQRRRIYALPGLSGYWQVNGKNRTTFRRMIAMDILYIKKWSLGLDIAIILKTGPVLCGQVIDSYHRWRARVRRASLNGRNGLNTQNK